MNVNASGAWCSGGEDDHFLDPDFLHCIVGSLHGLVSTRVQQAQWAVLTVRESLVELILGGEQIVRHSQVEVEEPVAVVRLCRVVDRITAAMQ